MDNQIITKEKLDNIANELNNGEIPEKLENQEAFDELCKVYGIDLELDIKTRTKLLMEKGKEIQKRMTKRENAKKRYVAMSNFKSFIRGR